MGITKKPAKPRLKVAGDTRRYLARLICELEKERFKAFQDGKIVLMLSIIQKITNLSKVLLAAQGEDFDQNKLGPLQEYVDS